MKATTAYKNDSRAAALLFEEGGQTIVEYALVVTTISIGAIAVLAVMTDRIGFIFTTLGSAL